METWRITGLIGDLKVDLTVTVPTEADGYSEGFEAFWSAYPKKIEKKKAYQIWKRIQPDSETICQMVKVLERQKQSKQWQERDGKFIPHPTTWLSDRRWENVIDDPPERSIEFQMSEYDKQYAIRRYQEILNESEQGSL